MYFFSVSRTTGDISMIRGTPRGLYDLIINVEDTTFGNVVQSTVAVTVRYLYDDAISSMGSMRLSGNT